MTGGRKIGLRVLLGAAVSLSLLLSGASAAYACNEPRIGVNPDEAEAGDRVYFTIDNTQPGAEYVVWLDGKEIAEGVDTTPASGVSGEFRMPDLGPEPREDVVVASRVEHRSTEHVHAVYEPDSVFIDYRVPASTPSEGTPPKDEPPTSTAGPGSADEAKDPPRETSDRSYEPRSLERDDRSGAGGRERDDRSGAGGREKPERFSPVATAIVRTAIVRRQAERDRSVGAAPAAPSVPGAGDATSGGEPPSDGSTSRGTETGATGERSLGAALARPHDAPITEIGATRPAHADLPAPSALILGLTLLALVTASVIAVAAVRRRRGGPNDVGEASATPPWVPPVVDADARARDLLIEAELQEMVAEHRAHELASGSALEPSPVGSGEVPASEGATGNGSLVGVG